MITVGGGGVHVLGRHPSSGQTHPLGRHPRVDTLWADTPRTATASGGTQTTGMHSCFLQNPLITATNIKGNVSDKCLTGRRNSLHLNSANCAFNWYNTAGGGVCGDDANLKSELSPTDKVVETDNWQCFYSILNRTVYHYLSHCRW